MRASKKGERTLHKPVRKGYYIYYNDRRKEDRRKTGRGSLHDVFDKNCLSESDMDKILAIS